MVVQGEGKEKTLSITFGEDESATALRVFLGHYTLARDQNIRKKVEGWEDKSFRANELRFQLRGHVAAWICQESAMLSEWVNDDDEIINQLKKRFLGTQSVELNIIAFENLRQNEGESLAAYMTRCQENGYQAFGDFDQKSTHQRIVWKFLSGIRDSDIRAAVIKAEWMLSSSEAKPFPDVLKIEETAKLAKVATAATGTMKIQESMKIAQVRSIVKEKRGEFGRNRRTVHSSNESNNSNSSRVSSSTDYSSDSRGSSGAKPKENYSNFLCHYCKERSHYGGWKMCEKRRKENPNWKPDF